MSNTVPPAGWVYHTPWSATAQYAAGLANSLVMWFWVPFAIGRRGPASRAGASALGALFMAVAFVTHEVHGWLVGHTSTGAAPAPPMAAVVLWTTLGIAMAGGVVAGLGGFLSRTRPMVALVLVLAVIAELERRNIDSWRNGIGAAENATFVLLAGAVITALAVRAARSRPVTASS
ncbi:hypothetical protein [Nocardiopsis sp. CNR-923]|uniref:hypothetical protein n=1 Tax=Nocardiopsis sp. CNR-923 TaxID=1904965 RepID=UPI00117CD03A|nr:hypothetical protein [Nocardiopsis sp. CNR-923]